MHASPRPFPELDSVVIRLILAAALPLDAGLPLSWLQADVDQAQRDRASAITQASRLREEVDLFRRQFDGAKRSYDNEVVQHGDAIKRYAGWCDGREGVPAGLCSSRALPTGTSVFGVLLHSVWRLAI